MRKLLVVIDPGHCGKWNRGANPKYWEGEKMFELACMEKAELEKYGIEVILTRGAAEDPGLQTRGKLAVTKGTNYKNVLFMSDHSNACNGTAKYVVGFRSAFLPKSEELGKKLVAAITAVMAPETGAWDNGLQTLKSSYGYDYYGVINAAVSKATTVAAAERGPVTHDFLFEHGFHDHPATSNWLVQSGNLQKLAEAKAKIIAEYFGYSITKDEKNQDKPTAKTVEWYRVLRKWEDRSDSKGSYHTYEYAKAAADKNPGYHVFDDDGKIVYPITPYQTTVPAEKHDPDDAGTYVCTASGLNIRKGPGTEYDSLAIIPNKATVECSGLYTMVDGTPWLLVSFWYGGIKYVGYSYSGYLKKIPV